MLSNSGTTTNDPVEIASILNQKFKNDLTVNILIVPSVVLGQCDFNALSMVEFSVGAVNSIILKMSNSKTITQD